MDESDKCHICLNSWEQRTVASLDSCQHVFCLPCILRWSQTANTCPVDRIAFTFIHQRRCPGGDIQKKIRVRTQRKIDDDEEEASDPIFCEECGRSNRGHRLLVCIHCDSGYHMDCLTPAVTSGPEGDWICPECAASAHHADGSVVEEEISDGEITDLLDEVDGAASTGGRLRPLTLNRLGGSAERRRSARVRSRTSGGTGPCPQASWHVPKYLLKASRPAAAAADNDMTPQQTTRRQQSISPVRNRGKEKGLT